MIKSHKDPQISETLNVIKKALEEDSKESKDDDILILNKLVNEDGTIYSLDDAKDENIISDNMISTNKIDDKLNTIFDKHFKKWLDNNMPDIINKYLKNKQ